MLLFILVATAALALDQLIKFIIVSRLAVGDTITVWPHLIYLTHVKNPGGAFSILAHHTALFVGLALLLIVVVLIVVVIAPEKDWRMTLALALLTGGVIGNMLDRIRTGYVTDYLYFTFWPVFNIADICITLGTIALLLLLLLNPSTRKGE